MVEHVHVAAALAKMAPNVGKNFHFFGLQFNFTRSFFKKQLVSMSFFKFRKPKKMVSTHKKIT